MRRRAVLPDPTEATRAPLPPPRVRVLIEDAAIAADTCGLRDVTWCDVMVCSGPITVHDACPLVLEGRCPLGPVDVVVSAIEGEWAPSIHAAWRETGTTVVDARTLAVDPPDERLAHHLGAAITARIGRSEADDD